MSPQPLQAPPFTSSVAPVMKPFISLAKKTTARATSSGVPARPSGRLATVAAALSGDVCVL